VQPLLEVKDLRTSFFTDAGEVRAVDGVSFAVAPGKLMGLVGESGSGKTASVLSIMRLLPERARVTGGAVLFEGRDLLSLSEPEMRAVRGAKIAMIFQEPMTSLNPVFTIGSQIGEAVRLHQHTSRRETLERTVEALRLVGIADPERRVNDYPHQLSGGMRQRVMIAMAFACNPELLIADEPTTALDVTIQGQILDLIADLVAERGMSMILISHDLGVIAENVQRMMVMYGGTVVENGDIETLFAGLGHPYSQGLFRARPKLGATKGTRLQTILGTVPELADLPAGCAFADRCDIAEPRCRAVFPPPVAVKADHTVRCLRTDVSMANRIGTVTA